MKNNDILKLTTTALFIALGILFPQFFHALSLGQVFSPMHIPILLCGLVCGAYYGMIAGAVVPLLSSVVFGMPPIFPMGVTMAIELATYGAACGIFRKLFYRVATTRKFAMPIALVCSMIVGRIAYVLAGAALFSLAQVPMTFTAFLTGAFVSSWPGMLLQLIFIPSLLLALDKYKVLRKYDFYRAQL